MTDDERKAIRERHKRAITAGGWCRICGVPVSSPYSDKLLPHSPQCTYDDVAALLADGEAKQKRIEELEEEKIALQTALNHNEGNQ